MPKLWLVAAVVLGSCCVGGLLLTAAGLRSGQEIVASARRWVDRELPPVLRSWDRVRFERLAADEFVERSGRDAIARTLKAGADRLGGLTRYEGATLIGYDATARTGSAASVVVGFRIKGAFERGPGAVAVRVVRVGTDWRLASFDVSDAK